MIFKLIVQPAVDMRPFVEIVGQQKVNEVDRVTLHPVAKIANLVDESLSTLELEFSREHLHYAFYFELDDEQFNALVNSQGLHMTASQKGKAWIGVVSGSVQAFGVFRSELSGKSFIRNELTNILKQWL